MRTLAKTSAAALLLAAPLAAQPSPPATDIWLADLAREGDAWTLAAPRNLTDRDGYDNQPAFSGDGRTLLYTAFLDGQTDVHAIDLASGTIRRLTATPESEYSPTPYEGGARFSVVRVEADGTQRLWSFAADGTDPRLLAPEPAGVGYHAWLGERRLALFVLGDPFTLRMLDLESQTATVVAERIGRSLHRVPGTAEASFVGRQGDDVAIFAIDFAGAHRRRLAPAPATVERDYAWTPDGALLAFVGPKLHRLRPGIDPDWVEIADVTAFGVRGATRLAVSPDGARLAFVADR
jgi:Tol biopolymer transport system component